MSLTWHIALGILLATAVLETFRDLGKWFEERERERRIDEEADRAGRRMESWKEAHAHCRFCNHCGTELDDRGMYPGPGLNGDAAWCFKCTCAELLAK